MCAAIPALGLGKLGGGLLIGSLAIGAVQTIQAQDVVLYLLMLRLQHNKKH